LQRRRRRGAAGIGLCDGEIRLRRFIVGARAHTLRQQASLTRELAVGERDARGRGAAIGGDRRSIAALEQSEGFGPHGIADPLEDARDGPAARAVSTASASGVASTVALALIAASSPPRGGRRNADLRDADAFGGDDDTILRCVGLGGSGLGSGQNGLG
jgi:hypothetical protein